MASVMPQAQVFIKIWMLQNEILPGTATLEDYLATRSGSIGMYFALPADQSAAFTKQNMEAVLSALAKAGLRGPVTFGVLKEGQTGLGDIDVETNFSKWCKEKRTGRVQSDGSITLK